MKQLLQLTLLLLFSLQIQAKDKEITGTYVSMVKGEGITFISFMVNGKRMDFEGIGFDKEQFEQHKNEPILIRYNPKYSMIENAYFLDGTNANNEKSVNAKYLGYKGKMDGMDYLIFDLSGTETIFRGSDIGARKIKKNKGKIYHIVYNEYLDGSKSIGSISLGSKPIVIKKPTKNTTKVRKTTKSNKKSVERRLKNATYKGLINYPVTLKNGKYKSSKDYTSVFFVKILAKGDMTGNGKLEYVVLLESSGGGSGSFPSASIMAEKNNRFKSLAIIPLGDRTTILSQKIKNKQLFLKIKDHGPNDPACCPKRVRTHIWKYVGNKLKKIKGPRIE